jgi:hypothetical protein
MTGKPKFAPWLTEAMASCVPGYGYITVTIGGAEISERQLVAIPRMFNSATIEVGWPPGKGEYIVPLAILTGAAELVIYRNESGPELIMAYDLCRRARGGDRLTIEPEPMRMKRLEESA